MHAFAGPLCRFYVHTGHDPVHLVSGIAAWREELFDGLGKKPKLPTTWSEDPRGDICRVDLGDSGLLALRLFGLYAEHSELELPDKAPALLELDKHWRAAVEAKFATSRYGHLLACGMWLPGDFPFTCRVPFPDGEMGELGSVAVVHDQLRFLNARTFQADAGDIASWRRHPAPAGGELLAAARRGFSGLWTAANFAVAHGQPLIVA